MLFGHQAIAPGPQAKYPGNVELEKSLLHCRGFTLKKLFHRIHEWRETERGPKGDKKLFPFSFPFW
jgi:hypothetical protein